MSQPTELKVTWWCTQCNTTGDLIFRNQDTVASRLAAAERDHKLHSPALQLGLGTGGCTNRLRGTLNASSRAHLFLGGRRSGEIVLGTPLNAGLPVFQALSLLQRNDAFCSR